MKSKTRYGNGVLKVKDPDNIKYEYDVLKDDVIDSKFFKKFARKKVGMKETTKQNYAYQVSTYCYFHQETIGQLINRYKKNQKELTDDETEEDLDVFYDLTDFANHAVENKQAKTTIQNKVKRVTSFLRKNGVNAPNIDVTLRTYDDSEGYFTKKDLPDQETMKTVISEANPKYKALFAFMYVSGSGRAETISLTAKSFIDGISEFCEHKETDPRVILKEIDGHTAEKNVIPLIQLSRRKTGKPYYTVITPETTQFIIDYIKTDLSVIDDLDSQESLFRIKRSTLSSQFQRVNLKHSWGKRGRNNFFSSHRLRHNHYTEINNRNLANALEGRKDKDKINNTYDHNLDDPEYLREQYKDHMYKFEIFDRYDVSVRDEEVQKLQSDLTNALKENEELKERLEDVESNVKTIEEGLSDLSPNELKANIIRDKISDYIRANNEHLDINADDIPVITELTTTISLQHEEIYNNGKGIKELIGKAKFELKLDKTLEKTLKQNIEKDEKLIEHVQAIWVDVMNYVKENKLHDVIGGKNEGDKLIAYLMDNKEKYVDTEITDELIIDVLKDVMYYDDVDYRYGDDTNADN